MAVCYIDWRVVAAAAPPGHERNLALHWSLIPYALCYALGVGASKIRERFTPSPRMGDICFGLLVALLTVYALAPVV